MTTEQEWTKLLCGVILSGIRYKLKHGEILTESQQNIVNMFPDYPWPGEENINESLIRRE